MSKTLPASPEAFGLSSFADLLPRRAPIIGEHPGSYPKFHAGLMSDLAPMTPYETLIAENLISIEWEILQHRRMRDQKLRSQMKGAIKAAVVRQQKAEHDRTQARKLESWLESGRDEEDLDEDDFDQHHADVSADSLAARAMSSDPTKQAIVYDEIRELGREPLELMVEAWEELTRFEDNFDQRLPGLEKRRREVRRDFDQLQAARPVDAGPGET